MLIALCDRDRTDQKRVAAIVRRMAEEKGLSLTFVGYPSLKALQHSLEVGKDGPDIVILDVDAPHEGGAEGALKLRSLGYEGILVFLSRDERYALPAFDARAFNYALKGDDGDDARLRRIIAEAVALARARRRRRILLNGISEHRNAPLDEIAWFEVDRHVCCAHFVDGGSFEFLSSLDAVEDKLAAFGFVRAHRTCLVNVRQIASVRFGRLTLLDGTELPVGRSKQALVREAFGKAMGSAADGGVAVVALHEES